MNRVIRFERFFMNEKLFSENLKILKQKAHLKSTFVSRRDVVGMKNILSRTFLLMTTASLFWNLHFIMKPSYVLQNQLSISITAHIYFHSHGDVNSWGCSHSYRIIYGGGSGNVGICLWHFLHLLLTLEVNTWVFFFKLHKENLLLRKFYFKYSER